jgi:hypothetical protein
MIEWCKVSGERREEVPVQPNGDGAVAIQQIMKQFSEGFPFKPQRDRQLIKDALGGTTNHFRGMLPFVAPLVAKRFSTGFICLLLDTFSLTLRLKTNRTLALHSHHHLPKLENVWIEEHLDRHGIHDVRCEDTTLHNMIIIGDHNVRTNSPERRLGMTTKWFAPQTLWIDLSIQCPQGCSPSGDRDNGHQQEEEKRTDTFCRKSDAFEATGESGMEGRS